MSFGIEIKDQNGKILLNNSFKFYKIVAQGTVVVPGWNSNQRNSAAVTVPHYGYGGEPLIFVRQTNFQAHGYLAYDGYSNSSGFVIRHATIGWYGSGINYAPVSVEYVVLIPTDNEQESDYGIAIYDEAGDRILSSGNTTVAIDGITTLPGGYYSSQNPPDIVYPSPPAGRNRFVLLNTLLMYHIINEDYEGGSYEIRYYLGVAVKSNTNVQFLRLLDSEPFPSNTGNFVSSTEIIDLANPRHVITGYF